MKSFKKKMEFLLKHNVLIGTIIRKCVSIMLRFCGIFFPVKKNTVLFTALGQGYNDSPKEIYEQMINDKRFSNYVFYWGLGNIDIEIPGNPIKIKIDTWKYFKTAFRCENWITCVNIERSFKFKKCKQKYLNTDHGVPIKKFGNQVAGRKDFNFKHINYFCVSGEFEANMYPSAYRLNPKSIIRTGLPRNDALYDISSDNVNLIKKKLKLENKKIILYAPTWRDSNDSSKACSLKPPVDFTKWRKILGDEYVVLLRAHHYTTELLGIHFDDFVRNFSDYKNVNDLLIISDILISDYSAILFDYSITEKPMFCFAYDYDQYFQERGLVIDLKNEFPGGIVYNEDDLLKRIININYELAFNEVVSFKNKYIEYGGNATSLCIETMFGSNIKNKC